MRRIFLIAVLLVFALSAFPSSQPAYARLPKIPRGFSFDSEYIIDGCTYQLWVVLHEETKGVGTASVDLVSPCLSGPLSMWGYVDRNEFNINGSLKSAKLKAVVLDEITGTMVVITDIKLRSVGNKPDDFFNPALVTGTVVFPDLGLTFTFDQDPIGGIWYGT